MKHAIRLDVQLQDEPNFVPRPGEPYMFGNDGVIFAYIVIRGPSLYVAAAKNNPLRWFSCSKHDLVHVVASLLEQVA